jgi:fatty acid desaturase
VTVTQSDTLNSASRLPHATIARHTNRGTVRRFELPTLGIAALVYGGFFLLTFFFHSMPLLVAATLGTLLLALHGSLQHEIIHGHPTPYRRLNNLLSTPPLALWIPYQLYRELHLRHHRHGGRYLTDPVRDPESYYFAPGTLAGAGVLRRAIYRAHRTLSGRMILGPGLALYTFWAGEFGKVRAGHRRHISIWVRHVLKVFLVLTWTVGVCRIPLLVYLFLIVYPSVSLSQLRSFAEHRYDADPRLRTVVVEGNRMLGLIFLNNNLHIAHHAYPKLAWYELPDTWRQMRASLLSSGLVFQGGYREVIARYGGRPVIPVEHPRTSVPAHPLTSDIAAGS